MKRHESDWSSFFLIGQFFILKKLQPKIYFCILDARSHWPGLLRCCVRALCVFLLIFCAAVCFYFSKLFLSGFALLLDINISFFGVVITKLVMQFFCNYDFCIFRHVVTYVLRMICLLVCLFFLFFATICAFPCLSNFLQCFCALLNCFLSVNCSHLHFLFFCRLLPVSLPRFERLLVNAF